MRGHMADSVFTIVGVNHHIEEWKSIYPNGRTLTGRFELRRTREANGPFGR
jgi:hypothetical protein